MTEREKRETLKTLQKFGLINSAGGASADFVDMIACREACHLYWGCVHTGESVTDLLVLLESLLTAGDKAAAKRCLTDAYQVIDRKSPGLFLSEGGEKRNGYGPKLYWAVADLIDLMAPCEDEMEENRCENNALPPC